MKRCAVVLLLAPLAAGCLTGRAQTPAQRPALEVPPPPPRVVEPLPEDPPTRIEPVAELPPQPAAASRPRSQPAREPRDTPKTEPKPEPPPAPETVPPANPPQNPAPQIRTPADNSETARQVRDMLDRTAGTLSKIDYQGLNRQHRESYDTAKRFMQEAEDALKGSNFVYANFLADKADKIAKELQGR